MNKSITKVKVLVVIPARLASTRLPRKPLKNIAGKPMIQRVYEQAVKMKTADKVVVATDSKEIFDCVTKFGGEAVMSIETHESGTDRVAEAALSYKAEVVVNIQGDEPFISPEAVDRAVNAVLKDKELHVATLCVPITVKEAKDKNVTCVVLDRMDYALYFSKAAIPHDRDGNLENYPLYKHLGTYIFRYDFLLYYAGLERTPLEKVEKLEQLRILENGIKILCVKTDKDSLGIDSPEDLEKAESIINSGVIDG